MQGGGDEGGYMVSGLEPEVEAKLVRMVSTRKRIDFLDALHTFSAELQSIALPAAEVDKKQALKDNDREEVLLNGVQFIGRDELPHFRSAMKAVALSATMSDAQADAIVERVLRSTSRTASGADSYFVVDRLLVRGLGAIAEPYLLLKPRNTGMIPPVRIDMHAAVEGGGGAHSSTQQATVRCKISTANLYGLYRLEDIECFTQQSVGEPEPWIRLDTEVREEFSFGPLDAEGVQEQRTARVLSVQTPEPAPTVSEELEESF